MNNQIRVKQIVGVALLILLAPLGRFVYSLTTQAGGWGWLVSGAFYLAMAVSLVLLGVAAPDKSALTYLVPGVVVCCFYLMAGMVQMAQPDAEMVGMFPPALGMLLITLTLLLGVWRAVQHKSLGNFDVKAAISIFALLLLACASEIVQRALHTYGYRAENTAAFTALIYFGWLYGALLIPFLRKDRFGGIALMAVGGVGLAVYLLVSLTPLRSGMDSIYNTLYVHVKIFVGLLLGGIWCMLPSDRKEGAQSSDI